MLGWVDEAGRYLYVRLFSWIDGDETERRVVALTTTTSWRFFADQDSWNEAARRVAAR